MTTTLYTIWHSTRSQEEFLWLLKEYTISYLVDVRSFPWSRKFPQFNKENLEVLLPQNNILYTHILKLWGRRKVLKNSPNTARHNASFRWYADYMETSEFQEWIQELTNIVEQSSRRVCIMCSEAVRWRCHRSMISDFLKSQWWTVCHILSETKLQEHPYTQPAQIIDEKLTYHDLSDNRLFE